MKTITIDGVEYILTPKQAIPQQSEPEKSLLADFLGEVDQVVVDDGLADNNEKEAAIRVSKQDQGQDHVVDEIGVVRKAQGRTYIYREKFIRHELTPGDIFAPNPYMFGIVKGYKDVPMIEADRLKPASQQLFYGEGTTIEGSSSY